MEICAIDIGYGYIKAVARKFASGEKLSKYICPATAELPDEITVRKVTGIKLAERTVVSFAKDNVEYSFRVGNPYSLHVLSPDARQEFSPQVIALILCAISKLKLSEIDVLAVGVPVGFVLKQQVGKLWLPSRYFVNGKEHTLKVVKKLVVGQTIGSIKQLGITDGIIVDIGYGTTDIVIVEGSRLVDAFSVACGVGDVVADIAKDGKNALQAEMVIAETPSVLRGLAEKLSGHITATLRKHNLPRVYFVGGGSHSAVVNSLKPRLGNVDIYVQEGDNRIWVNALGMLEIAQEAYLSATRKS